MKVLEKEIKKDDIRLQEVLWAHAPNWMSGLLKYTHKVYNRRSAEYFNRISLAFENLRRAHSSVARNEHVVNGPRIFLRVQCLQFRAIKSLIKLGILRRVCDYCSWPRDQSPLSDGEHLFVRAKPWSSQAKIKGTNVCLCVPTSRTDWIRYPAICG